MEKVQRFFLSFLFILFFLLSGYHEVIGGTITVKPGRFSHFTLHIPSTPIAGDSFVVRLQAYDIYNNLITDFNETGRDFEIMVSGSAQVEPRILRASNFRGGSALVSIRDKKAERITVSVLEIGGTIPILAKEIAIRPNRLDHFFLQSPFEVKAGESFEIRVIARDAFENMVLDDTAIGKDLKINIGGTGGIKSMDTGALNFRAGVATARFLSEKVGEVAVEIYDPLSGSRGKSPSIKIMPGGLSLFSVQTPKEGVAGDPFEVIITALDTHGNPITNYDSTGDGVILSSTGKGKIRPDRISPSEFKGGSIIAKVVYEIAESMEIIATESNKRESGRSGTVKIRPATPDHFLVITPDTASAGQAFKLRIEAYDRFNNPVRDYNLIGGHVYMGTTGSGTLTPSLISPSEFIDGVAVVDAIYDKAESFSITARIALKREEIKIEEKKEKVVKPPVEKKVEPLPTKVEERPKPIAPEVKAKPEVKPKPEIKPVPKKVREKEVIKRPEPKKEIVKKEIEPRLFEVSDISIVESKKRAILVITSNGPLEHKTSFITKDGKRWLNLEVSPAVRKMEKIQRLKSSFVGNVILEEKEGNVLSILLEILPEMVTYEARRSKDSIVITFTLQK
jgi:hypothetical protein